jgi:hypothetical protein
LLLADEPTGNVDPSLAQRLPRLFVELNRLGRRSSLPRMTSHSWISTTRRLVLHGGRICHECDVDAVTAAPQPGAQPQFVTPIVPKGTIAGRALVAIVAIMTFLASLTTGAVVLVRAAASDWQSEVAREVTIQVRPVGNRDLEADVGRAADIARRFPGVADVRVFSKEESSHLLEPWLGTGLVLEELPVPRLAVVRIASGATPEFARLGKLLADQVPSASLTTIAVLSSMRSMGRAVWAASRCSRWSRRDWAVGCAPTRARLPPTDRGRGVPPDRCQEHLHRRVQRRFSAWLQGGMTGRRPRAVRPDRARKPPFP